MTPFLPMPTDGGTYMRRADGSLERVEEVPVTDTPAAPEPAALQKAEKPQKLALKEA